MKYDVFISYSRADAAWATRLAGDLKRQGIETFFDQDRITAGDAWEIKLTLELQGSQNLIVLWSENARASNWVAREIGHFDAIRYQGGQGSADPTRRLIFINLEGKNTAYSSVQHIDDLQAAIQGGANASDVPGGLWTTAVSKVVAAIQTDNPANPVPLAVFAMTKEELGRLDPRSDSGIGRPFEDLVRDLGFSLDGADAPELVDCYGEERGDWRPFGGAQSVKEILAGILGDINGQIGAPGYRWEPIDFMQSNPDEARRRVAAFCAGPAAIVVDPLSLYYPPISFRYRLLQECTKNEHALIAAFAPVAPSRPIIVLRDLTRDLAAPLIDPYYRPPIPRHPHPLYAVNVGDRSDMDRLIRSCLGRFASDVQARTSTPYLRTS